METDKTNDFLGTWITRGGHTVEVDADHRARITDKLIIQYDSLGHAVDCEYDLMERPRRLQFKARAGMECPV